MFRPACLYNPTFGLCRVLLKAEAQTKIIPEISEIVRNLTLEAMKRHARLLRAKMKDHQMLSRTKIKRT